jgi:nucleoside-diphosphate kinase
MGEMQRTVVLVKPDAVGKKLVGEVIARFEKEGFKIVAMKMVFLNKARAEKFYRVHKEKDFFPGLIKFMTRTPSVAMIVEGEDAVRRVREVIGERVPREAKEGTIRRDLASDGRRNIVHGSDSEETVEEEISCLFSPEEICSYNEGNWLDSEPG